MRKKIEASYTVEAAFIIPLVFALLCGIVFLAFRLHDITILGQCAWESAFYGAGQAGKVTEEEISDYLEAQLKGTLLISQAEDVRVLQEEKGVSVSIAGKSESILFAEGLLGIRQKRQIRAEYTVGYPSASEYVRKGLIISSRIKSLWDRKEEENR